VAQVNHLVESGAEKIVGGHQNFPQFLSGFYGHYFNFSGISWDNFLARTSCLPAFQAFCRGDYCSDEHTNDNLANALGRTVLRRELRRQCREHWAANV